MSMVGCRFKPLELLDPTENDQNDQNDDNACQVQSDMPSVSTKKAPTEDSARQFVHPLDRWRALPAPERLEKTWQFHERFIALRDVLQYKGSALKLDWEASYSKNDT